VIVARRVTGRVDKVVKCRLGPGNSTAHRRLIRGTAGQPTANRADPGPLIISHHLPWIRTVLRPEHGLLAGWTNIIRSLNRDFGKL